MTGKQKGIMAPLCPRCAKLLGKTFTVERREESRELCPWCQRNEADAVYRLELHYDRKRRT